MAAQIQSQKSLHVCHVLPFPSTMKMHLQSQIHAALNERKPKKKIFKHCKLQIFLVILVAIQSFPRFQPMHSWIYWTSWATWPWGWSWWPCRSQAFHQFGWHPSAWKVWRSTKKIHKILMVKGCKGLFWCCFFATKNGTNIYKHANKLLCDIHDIRMYHHLRCT